MGPFRVAFALFAVAGVACASADKTRAEDSSFAPDRSADLTDARRDDRATSEDAPLVARDAEPSIDAPSPAPDAELEPDAKLAPDAQPAPDAVAADAEPPAPLDAGPPAPLDAGPPPCAAPRHYTFAIPGGTPLICATPDASTTLLSVSVPDVGLALGRAAIAFTNTNSSATYYWSAQVLIGSPRVYYAVGDDVCPGSTTISKVILGYGQLDATNAGVAIIARQGSSPCADGQVVVASGTLDLWVEDSSAGCAGHDIQLISSYDVHGLTATYGWTTDVTQILSLPVTMEEPRSEILVLGDVEGTPSMNPNNTCGSETATLVAQVETSALGVLATDTEVIPASSGLGHVVLAPSGMLPYDASLTSVSLWVGSNTDLTTVTTGGCCGDAKLGFVKLP
jgi:hypothetical protein